jgi:hypothetical protein
VGRVKSCWVTVVVGVLALVLILGACGSPSATKASSLTTNTTTAPTGVTYNGLGQPTSGSGPTNTSSPPVSGPTATVPNTTSPPAKTGAASLFVADGFSYTVAAGPIVRSIYSRNGTPAAPGWVY